MNSNQDTRKIETPDGLAYAIAIYSTLENARDGAWSNARYGGSHVGAIAKVGTRYWLVSGRTAGRLRRAGHETFSTLRDAA